MSVDPCGCIDKYNAKFAKENQRLQTKIWTNLESEAWRRTVVIGVEKVNTRQRTRIVHLIPTYCPMCGQKYVHEGQS